MDGKTSRLLGMRWHSSLKLSSCQRLFTSTTSVFTCSAVEWKSCPVFFCLFFFFALAVVIGLEHTTDLLEHKPTLTWGHNYDAMWASKITSACLSLTRQPSIFKHTHTYTHTHTQTNLQPSVFIKTVSWACGMDRAILFHIEDTVSGVTWQQRYLLKPVTEISNVRELSV